MNRKKVAAVCCGILAAVYAAGCLYFEGHLYPHTTLDGRDASYMDRTQAAGVIRQSAAEGTLTIRVEDQTYTLNRADACSVADPDQAAQDILHRNVPAWPVEIFRTHNLSSGRALTFERDRAEKALEPQGIFDYELEPQDAYIADFTEEKGYTIVPDVNGWKADRGSILDAVGEAVISEVPETDLTERFEVRASVRADDPELNRIAGEKNALVHHSYTLKLGDSSQTLTGTELNSWLTTSRDGRFGLDAMKLYAYADNLQNVFADSISDLQAADGVQRILVDAGLFERILAAKLKVTLPAGETEKEKKARESANAKIMKQAEQAAKKAKTQEEKDQILADAAAKQTPEPEMIALPYVTEESAATASDAEKEAVQTAIDSQNAEQEMASKAVLKDGIYIANLETAETRAAREEKAAKQVPPATRSNALLPDDPEEAETIPDTGAETVEVAENEIYVPVLEADPAFQLGFGLDYIDIDIENQHVTLFENARKVMESDCVTGLPTPERETHKGLFHINYKQRNRILRGSQKLYASFVNYWMPFDAGIGLHDATWRSSFGGKIYTYSGSHGCVNLPLSFAKKLYKRVYTGEPVYVH